jgi:hypothetical protein
MQLVSLGELVYLPGDIHDTLCVAWPPLFRFTQRDLRHEDQVEHRITRIERDGIWTSGEHSR